MANNEKQDKFSRSILWSFGLHIVFSVLAVVYVQFVDRTPPQKEEQLVWIELEEPSSHRKQIVETDQGREVKEAEKDAFLGEKNLKVKKQQIAKSQNDLSVGKKSSPKKQATAQEKSATASPSGGALSRFGVAMLPQESMSQAHQRKKQQQQPKWTDYGTDYRKYSREYVKGLKEGETTALNTKEYVFYSYFKRIRERLDRTWRSTLREHLVKYYRKGRSLASDRDHHTKTLVTLNDRGHIIRVQLVEESGVRDLDSAAVNAFNKAGPFPNPPKGLVDRSGKIEIRWDFILRT